MLYVSEPNAEASRTNEQLCGKWMPRKGTHCARGSGHAPPCATPESMENHRVRRRARTRNDSPEAVKRWKRKHRLARYGLTPGEFDRLLELQSYACGMCRNPFEEDKPVYIDHDHSCCPDEKRSCGECVRGLLCLSCNTALGQIERKYALARTYLDRARQTESAVTRAERAETDLANLPSEGITPGQRPIL